MKTLPFLATILLSAPLAMAQTDHTFDVVTGQSQFHYGGTTSLGDIVGRPNNFRLTGSMAVNLTKDASTGLFTDGQMTSGALATNPTTLHAVVPNPISFLPDLADLYIRDAVFSVTSDAFTVDAAGNYSTMIILTAVSGEVEVVPLIGATTITPLASSDPSDPTPVTGMVYDDGTNVVFTLAMDVTFQFDDGTTSADIWIDGNAVSAHDSGSTLPPTLAVSNLNAGQTATFDFVDGDANAPSFLAYSLAGLGATWIAQLNVFLDIANPTQAGPMLMSNALGQTTWNLPIPGNAAGASVWFQAIQHSVKTNVAAEVVQ
ncbi:MAG: hypothetical protein HOM34_09025 [Planctomycetes bacterium]|jgi:hypothetical protein|nr:hypothetical protein [Planctomycetota bacterium]MBT4027940.1 hypothetical protein [Planctomycetota bacterium]MBT4560055.1 hypothetical protein [Planctomycetota bacterium]MBT5102338.1 hypothetical protein [Planctomycetota bacterium]MBT5120850.1 hypothetical protein [Planctomycetota bacterium]